ncbi:NAD-dependent epimerase/dehydratase family protein [Polynucleobacter sp. MWH-UH24A]|uniref:NAD-dependent epimerase/dehydratase family protein n=1 Tax=Polynucleobacter sp. MWH-UH24A TaxID=2689110 RepID=UPI001BFD251A|nr:NAD-dependent epimerase/dehydratase family protein [Polynucleobacter sp. MWH-UH24A]QWD76422.1 NAD-dependent epimerase/dehydratase family protein [Polynucleobacter sp. MWH-UH24A]
MSKKSILITGSSGLIGGEVLAYFAKLGFDIHGVDNDMRAQFFGPSGSTAWNRERLKSIFKNFHHYEIDIRDRNRINALIDEVRPNVIIHAAAQPSHDRAAEIPFDDFDTNAVGTMNILEACRKYCTDSPFIHLSTNKVYGDAPNNLKLIEKESRWDFADPEYHFGISEHFSIDQSKHSLFGASKLAADILVQEYGRYFGIPTCCLRGGCLTGPSHSGVELHGFLSYLIKCNVQKKMYTIFGYKGKQVRDNIHAWDVANFIQYFIDEPRVGEVYNIGGGVENSISILEAISLIQSISGESMITNYKDEARSGDHIVYYSDLRKIRAHYPKWKVTKSLHNIFNEIYTAQIAE